MEQLVEVATVPLSVEQLRVVTSGAAVQTRPHEAQGVEIHHAATPIAHASLTADEHRRIEEAAYMFGNAPESYDVASSAHAVLRTPNGEGFLNVHKDGPYWHMPGGIIADDIHKPATVHWLKSVAIQQRKTIAVYSVSAEEVPLFQEAGFAVNKFGEEPVIDLHHIDWHGKPFEWVRRQTNYCRRHGLNVVEIQSAQEQQAMAKELTEVFFDDLRDRVYSKPLHLLEGRFDPTELGRRRLFIVRQPQTGKMEGFLIISPTENGTSWAFETYRKRRDATRGTIPFLFREVIDRLQAEGVRRISLCLVPGRGVHADRSESADSRVRWLLGMWYNKLQLIFSASGQDYFKSRFRPRYTDRYICVYPRNTYCSIFSFLNTSGALRINPCNLLRQVAVWLRILPKPHH